VKVCAAEVVNVPVPAYARLVTVEALSLMTEPDDIVPVPPSVISVGPVVAPVTVPSVNVEAESFDQV
jgi:hypothetical protein